jgi:hypothetical protein
MPTVDYLPIAAASTADVDSQADFDGAGYQINGFTVGATQPAEINKCFRQPSMFSSAWAYFISSVSDVSVLDDGNRPALTTLIINALTTFVNTLIAAATPAAHVPVVHDETGSRALATEFTNTTGFTMIVGVTGGVNPTSGSTFTAVVNGITVGQQSVVAAASAGALGTIYLFVPAGGTYEVTTDGMSMTKWIETY